MSSRPELSTGEALVGLLEAYGVDTIFGIPGVGLLLLNAIGYRDAPTVEAVVAFLGCCVVVANLVGDLMYGLLDPRARYGSN